MKKLNIVNANYTGAGMFVYTVTVKSGQADSVWEDILRLDSKAKKLKGNPNFLTVNTGLNDTKLLSIDNVEDVYEKQWEDLVRYIPTGSKVYTKLKDKEINIRILYPLSAPPMTTKQPAKIESDILRYVNLFIKDISEVLKIKDVQEEAYVHMEAEKGKIIFIYSFTVVVPDKNEGKKLKDLDDALSNYKKRKI